MTPGGLAALDALDRMGLPTGLTHDVAIRLRKGAEEYGDESLRRSRAELLAEIREGALDVIGWTAVLMVREDLTVPPRELRGVVGLAALIAGRAEGMAAGTMPRLDDDLEAFGRFRAALSDRATVEAAIAEMQETKPRRGRWLTKGRRVR